MRKESEVLEDHIVCGGERHAAPLRLTLATSWPSMVNVAWIGSINRLSRRIRVDFPLPESHDDKISPVWTLKVYIKLRQ